MSTKVYGTSDDLIEFEGDVYGEVGAYGTDEEDSEGVLVTFSDGTLLVVKYGKAGMGIWGIIVIVKGSLFENNEPCSDENAKPYSDVVTFKDGLKWAYASKTWEKVS